jgi:glucose-fructose oxidoreductase
MFGAGNFGAFFARYVEEFAHLVAICDPSPAARARFAEVSGLKLPEYDDYNRLLAEVDVDGVVLTGPNHTHKPITLAAAKRGRHVFCEKAMAPSVPDCWEMVRACRAANVRLMVGHKRRLRPAWARAIELRDTVGPVVAMSVAGYFDSRPDEFRGWWTREAESGGVLALSGVHELDWMRALCGDVEAVSAVAAPPIDPRYDFPDSIHVNLRFRSGAIGFLGVSLSYPLLRYRHVQGGNIVCREGGIRLATSLHDADLYWKRLDESEAHHERFEEPGGNPVGAEFALRREFSEFVAWVEKGATPSLTWREGLRAVELIEAARRSSRQGGSWIGLPLYPELEDSQAEEN